MNKKRRKAAVKPSKAGWRGTLANRLPLFGHRNWIAVVDSAYPAQVGDGIETILSNSDQVEAVQDVLACLARSEHVKAMVYTDQELECVEEKDAPGISAYRRQLVKLLADYTVDVRPHDQNIAALDEAGKTFRVLIVKTKLTLPYTSVFLYLDCAYWNADAERRLRAALASRSRGTARE
jgi:hypothetical protein